MLIKKEGDEQMEDKEMEKEGYDYTAECIDKLDSMIENPKLATPEGLMEIRDKLANEGEMEQEEPKEEEMDDEGKPSLVIAIGKGLKKGMKLLILSATFVGICTSICMAEHKYSRKDWDKLPENYFYAYSTASLTTVTPNQVAFPTNTIHASTYPALIHTFNIETVGVNSTAELWNVKFGTSVSGNDLMFVIDTTTSSQTRSLLYDVYFDSGVYLFNRGETPARVSVTFKER